VHNAEVETKPNAVSSTPTFEDYKKWLAQASAPPAEAQKAAPIEHW
jgi:hypothetical protein